MTDAGRYKDTVNLPQTSFEMRANAVKRELELQQFWSEHRIYEHLSQFNPGDPFILHDGPPYANGSLHMGHALNKILKDIINKYQLLRGRKVRYIPGWDCHGLPIELKVLQDLKPEERRSLQPIDIRQRARDFALKTVDEQRQGFQRYGIWGDWEHPYLTLKPQYEAAQIGVFGQMVLKGHIYRGFKPVHWSPSSKTALAEAELEYPEGHTSRSVYAAFEITSLSMPLRSPLDPYLGELGVAIWTTTPWTIPANLAVSVNPDLIYAVVELGDHHPGRFKYLIVAAELVERLAATLNTTLTVQATVMGKTLEHTTYRHPLDDFLAERLRNRQCEIVIGGDYVTTESGTGLVHTAPGHGLEDYAVGQRYGLPILAPVDADGRFTEEAGEFAGLNVLKEGNAAVVDALKGVGSLLKEEAYVHKYPYDWRTKQPTIFRATEQWFASVAGFRDAALQAIAQVQWIPAQGQNRITAMVGERSDWCISRQRSWGVPIPVFYDEETGEPLLNADTIGHVQAIIAEKGSDAWWELPVAELLPESYRNGDRRYRKGTDTMDVWFDSGSSWAAVLVGGNGHGHALPYPADLYLEGSDQHRGWFQSSLLTSVAVNNCAPYKSVLTHGFTLDEQGRKMSKSLGNVVDPRIVIEGGKNQQQEPAYGADVLRLWVSSVDYSNDVPIGKTILKQMSDVYRKIRNTARFLLGNLHDFDPVRHIIPYDQLPELDRYMLHRMTEVFDEVTDAFNTFQFFRFFQTIQNFCVVDLSNFYLDVAKDRLYISAVDAPRRRSCQTVLAIAVENLAKAIAPVLCHMAEDIWQALPYSTPHQSVFAAGWVQMDEAWRNPDLATRWQTLREIRAEVNKVMEQARSEKAIGASLEAKVLLYVADAGLRQQLEGLNPAAAVSMSPSTSQSAVIPDGPTIAPPTPEPVEEFMAAVDLEEPVVAMPKVADAHNQLQQLLAHMNTLLSSLPDDWGEFIQTYRLSAIVAGGVVVAIVGLKVLVAVITALNEVPLVAPTFQLVGLIVVLRYVVRARDRQAVWMWLQRLVQKILGDQPTDLVRPAVSQATSVQSQSQPQITIPDAPLVTPAVSVAAEPTSLTLELQDAPTLTGNGVDELRYLFIASQVELLDSTAPLQGVKYSSQTETLGVGVVNADGQKCVRCWNYSTTVGESEEHPLICDRCVAALGGNF